MDELLDLKQRLEQERPTPWAELPDLALYMDQIISYMPRQLIHFDDGEVLTSAMVNNYIKDGLVPRADGKRYGPIHLGYLTAVCALKRVLSVRDMKVLISAGEKREKPPEELYAYFLQALDRALNETAQSLPPQAAPEDLPRLALAWPCAAMPASWPVHASWISSSPRARRPQKRQKSDLIAIPSERHRSSSNIRRSILCPTSSFSPTPPPT